MICEQCKEREAEFDAPGKWCEVCWAKWWYEDIVPENEEQREDMIKEASELFKNIETNLIRKFAEQVICPVGS